MAATTAIRVCICDDHAPVRASLMRLLEPENRFDIVGEAADAEQAVACVALHRPDILLLDLVMPGRSGIDAIPDLLAASPETHILVLSMQDDPSYARQALAAGAHGYLLKDVAAAELLRALDAVAAGDRYVHPTLKAQLDVTEVRGLNRAGTDLLTGSEHDVMRLLALGHTNQEIAKLLTISVGTTETHRARIMQKLRLSSRAELVRYALGTGELQLLTS
jgi:two-component system response regulator NreC